MDMMVVHLITTWLFIVIISVLMMYLVRQQLNPPMPISLPLEDHGISKGESFPLSQPTEDIDSKDTLILITSASCDPCKKIYPHLRSFREEYPEVRMVMYLIGTPDEERVIVDQYQLDMAIIRTTFEQLESELQTKFVPFGYFVDQDHLVLSKGGLGHVDHLHVLLSKSGSERYAS